MTRRYWITPALVLVGLFMSNFSAFGQEKLTWKAFEGKEPFFQKLSTKTEQKLAVSGMDNKQTQTQTFWFKWTPEGKKDGKYVVTQKIVGLEMDIEIGGNKISYKSWGKEQPKSPMTQFFKALVGQEFKLTIDPNTMKVTEVSGVDALKKKLINANQAMKQLLNSILTVDAVKKMADPVLGVVPPKGEIPKDGKWSNTTTLDMGPIGTYETTNTYTVEKDKAKKKIVPITVKTDLKYSAPKKAKEGGDLPFVIEEAKLNSKDSGGDVQFNREKGRIESSTLHVHLSGTLKVNIAQTSTDVTLNQDQTVQMNTYDVTSMELPEELREKGSSTKKDKKEKGK